MTELNLDLKYRSGDLSEVVGQPQVTKVLSQYLKEETLPKSLLFYGPPGTGKTSTARIVAKMLNPHHSGLIEKDSAIDGKVDNIRSLQTEILHYPMEGDFKTYIFDEAHRITAAGFDSLLKTIEEPPKGVRFIFVTTNREQIPETVQSRCELHQFNRIPNNLIEDRLKYILKAEKKKLPDELLNLAVESGDGSMRVAIVSLQTILTLYENDEKELDITKTLGIVSSKNLSNLVYSYLFQEFFEMRNHCKVFNPEIVDPIKGIHSLQQFTADLRYGLASKDLIPDLKSNVGDLLDRIWERYKTSGMDERSFQLYIGGLIHKLWEKSLDIEVQLKKTSNKSTVVEMIPVELAQLWKKDA
jgi:DNA polymerase III subunit gamma/tau